MELRQHFVVYYPGIAMQTLATEEPRYMKTVGTNNKNTTQKNLATLYTP